MTWLISESACDFKVNIDTPEKDSIGIPIFASASLLGT